MPIHLQRAEKIAATVVAAITPFCERIEIAGSVRRRRSLVGDIDLVILPKVGEMGALRERVGRACTWVREGNQEWVLQLPIPGLGLVQLDIWIAAAESKDLFEVKPSNWGSLLLCRTGSMEHNIFLIERAKTLGLRWNPHWGVFDGHGKCLASATEDEVFAALQMEFVPPERRDR